MEELTRRRLVGAALAGVAAANSGVAGETAEIKNPRHLQGSSLAVERIPVGVPDDYKPCLALLPNGELLMVAFHQYSLGKPRIYEDFLQFRSRDGGRTWSGPETCALLGREFYASTLADGTVFLTVHLLEADVRNKDGYTHPYVHRSADGGRHWTTTRIDGLGPRAEAVTTRNVLELPDGTALFGVSDNQGNHFLWRSRDHGVTWEAPRRCDAIGFKSRFEYFGEAVLWSHRSGKILNIVRVDSREFPLQDRPAPQWLKGWNDNTDHLVLYESDDGGRTMRRVRDFADYGIMYPAVLRLRDGRLLLTFTVRSIHPPLGIHAVLGRETADGFDFDFEHDRIVLDAKTPVDKPSGGGFGRTIQLDDGTLVTSYSYRGADDRTHMEVARWRLPGA
jgi:hypothetical protein